MRMRKSQIWAHGMERCADWWVREPEGMPGRWQDLAPSCKTLWVEVGCGKGRFTVETAAANPDMLLIAMERVPDAMVVAGEAGSWICETCFLWISMWHGLRTALLPANWTACT